MFKKLFSISSMNGINLSLCRPSAYSFSGTILDVTKINVPLSNNKLNNLFDDLFSIEDVKIYKPDPSVYELPIKKYRIKSSEITFLSANTWDVSGGGNFGYNSIWVNRNNSVFDLLDFQPKNEINNLTQLLDKV